MHIIRKIFFLIALSVSIIIIREFISLYTDLRSIDPYLGYAFLIVISLVIIYFALIPLIKILLMPKSIPPAKNKADIHSVLDRRLKSFSKNPLLTDMTFHQSETRAENYKKGVSVLEERVKLVRKDYIAKVFYGTAVSQNGFLDAIIIFSASVNLVKEIFITYNGRVSNKDLLTIGRKIYTAMAIGGSEGVEYATDEIISSLASDGLKSIPFIDKIMGSIADGFVNAMLVTRVAYVTENYCKLVHIESEKDLLPSFKIVYETTKLITDDVRIKIKSVLKNMSTEKNENFAKFAVNPAGYVIHLATSKITGNLNSDSRIKRNVSNVMRIALNPIGFGFDKISGLFGKNS